MTFEAAFPAVAAFGAAGAGREPGWGGSLGCNEATGLDDAGLGSACKQ